MPLNVFPDAVREAERRAELQAAQDELRQIGFGDRDREDDLYGLFLPLHRYERSYDLTYRFLEGDEEHRYAAMVANVRTQATFAVNHNERIRLLAVSTDSMVRALLSILPETTPGPGSSVSLRSAALDKAAAHAGEDNQAMISGLTQLGVRRDEARTLVDMAGMQRLAYAQFGGAVMDGLGKRTRAPQVTNCFATSKGWYLLEESKRSSEPWTTIAPIDKSRMESRIKRLLS